MGVEDLSSTTYERVRDAIRTDIANGVLPAGHRLKLAELVKRYGTSAIPIRDALQQLQGEGFIVFLPNRGASVRQIDRSFLWQIYEIRKAVELYFVTDLAEKGLTPSSLDELRSLLKQHEQALVGGDEGRVHDLDWAFHLRIIGASANAEAASLLGRHYTMIRPLRVRFGRGDAQRKRIPHDHAEILAAIEHKDSAQARRLIASHIDTAFEDLVSLALPATVIDAKQAV